MCDIIKKNLLTFYRVDVGGRHLGPNDMADPAMVGILSFALLTIDSNSLGSLP